MKKILIILVMFSSCTAAMAQTKKDAGKKQPVKTDSLSRVLTDKDIFIRASTLKNLQSIIENPDDITPRQKKEAMRIADSLFRVDAIWYNKIHPVPPTQKQ